MEKKRLEIKIQGNKMLIEQQDCITFLQSIETGSIDVIITDPAYSGMNNKLKLGRGRIVGTYADKGQVNGKWFSEFEDTEENYKIFLSECKRVLNQKTGHLYIMFDSFSLLSLAPLVREYFSVKNILVWDKVNMGMGHYFRRRHEFIMFATNGNNRKINSKSIPDILQVKRVYNAEYPTQKPVEIFDIMLKASAKQGFTVCDPFLGSGSSAIAAMQNNCHFLGCDVSEKSFDISTKRVKQFVKSNIDLPPKGISKKFDIENMVTFQMSIM